MHTPIQTYPYSIHTNTPKKREKRHPRLTIVSKGWGRKVFTANWLNHRRAVYTLVKQS